MTSSSPLLSPALVSGITCTCRGLLSCLQFFQSQVWDSGEGGSKGNILRYCM